MKHLYVVLAAVIILTVISGSAFAEYKENITNGNKAYKAAQWADADAWYRKAYSEKPSERLKTLIAAIENKIGGEKSAPVNAVEVKTPVKPFDAGPLLLITTDVLLAGAAAYMVYYGDSAQEEYDELYREINNTTGANYDRLVKKQKETYQIMTLESVALAAASAALVYTFGDMFFTHEVFKKDTAMIGGIAPNFAYLKIERRF
jgi:hypothetical protein